MLTTVLDRLTGLTSKYFVLGAFVPVLVFGFLNGVILYLEVGWFRAWAEPQLSVAARAVDVVATLVGLAVVAYVLWGLSGFLRQVLEGQHLRRESRLAGFLRGAQLRRLRAARHEYQHARDAAAGIAAAKPHWVDQLVDAAIKGNEAHAGRNSYDGQPGNAAADALATLRRRRERAEPPEPLEVQTAVAELGKVLAENDIDTAPAALERDRDDLYVLLDYAEDEWAAREAALGGRLQARFGAGAVAATAFGNVGESMQSYTLSRYRLNLPTFWSRLQPLLQKHQEFYAGLQDAKVQVDFLVSCVFLSALTTVFWVVALPFWGDSVWLLLAVLVLGPLITWGFYLAATENYVAFGELVRTSVDLYRFELLDALHLNRPRSLRDERLLWNAMQLVASSGQPWVDLGYRHDDTAKA
jgi:hypothetical protein